MVWNVICEPIEGNTTGEDRKNEGGLVVYLENGPDRREVSRVAYNRKNGSQPRVGFDKALQKEIEKARVAADTCNRLTDEADRADKAAEAARVKVATATPTGGKTPLR